MIRSKTRVGRELIQRTPLGYATTSVARAAVEEEQKEESNNFSQGNTIKAYGLYWDRSRVSWLQKPHELLGYRTNSDRSVDFADQDGIYLLHHGSEIVYVGQTHTTKSDRGLYGRLRVHNKDARKTGRWDSFSWFGFRAVNDETGDLEDPPESIPTKDVITLTETILIECLMTRLNMRTGEHIRQARDSRLYFQTEGAI